MGEEILRTEGIRGLFRGWALRGVWTAVGIELCLRGYESGRWLKGRRWLENGKGGLFELAKGGGVVEGDRKEFNTWVSLAVRDIGGNASLGKS